MAAPPPLRLCQGQPWLCFPFCWPQQHQNQLRLRLRPVAKGPFSTSSHNRNHSHNHANQNNREVVATDANANKLVPVSVQFGQCPAFWSVSRNLVSVSQLGHAANLVTQRTWSVTNLVAPSSNGPYDEFSLETTLTLPEQSMSYQMIRHHGASRVIISKFCRLY